jgi:hypothetical protein
MTLHPSAFPALCSDSSYAAKGVNYAEKSLVKLVSGLKLYVPDLLQGGSQKCVPEVQGHDGSADHLRRRCDNANKLSVFIIVALAE